MAFSIDDRLWYGRLVWLPLFIIFLVLVAGLRYGIGTDYESYIEIYQRVPPPLDIGFSDIQFVEPGFLLLCIIAKSIFGSFVFVSIATSLIIFINLFFASKRFNINPLLSIPVYVSLFYLSHQFNIIRHGIAMSFVWLAISYIDEKRFLRFLLFILLGSLFHKIALLVFPLYFILGKRLKFYWVIGAVLLCFIIGIYTNVFNNPILNVLFADSRKYQYYINDYYKNINGQASFGISFGTVFNIVIVLIIYHSWFLRIKTKNIMLANALFFGVCAVGLLNKNGVFVERISGIFYLSIMFIIPQFFLKNRRQWLILICVMFYCLFYYWKTLHSKEADGRFQYIPYQTVLSK